MLLLLKTKVTLDKLLNQEKAKSGIVTKGVSPLCKGAKFCTKGVSLLCKGAKFCTKGGSPLCKGANFLQKASRRAEKGVILNTEGLTALETELNFTNNYGRKRRFNLQNKQIS